MLHLKSILPKNGFWWKWKLIENLSICDIRLFAKKRKPKTRRSQDTLSKAFCQLLKLFSHQEFCRTENDTGIVGTGGPISVEHQRASR
jgi:hypothetical protein